MDVQIPKGLFDILPYQSEHSWQLSHRWQYIESVIRQLCIDYNCQEIRTPILEKTELFHRGVGETSDIVSKEMYTFLDKGGRSLSLRPEGTASVSRAFLEHNLFSSGNIHKLYYIGPMFRYERPQAGRYRQHHQFGAEIIGNSCYEQDAEVIDLLFELYKRLGLKNICIHINSVGDASSRILYKEALLSYLKPYFEKLSEDSKQRFEKNPLRILDSKDPNDREIVTNAPSILQHLSPEAKKHFDSLLYLLDVLKIPYKVNDRLVRGLDYYTHTVFEVVSETKKTSIALGGGGRYDGLIESFGGPALPGVGFGVGMERLLQAMEEQNAFFPPAPAPFIYFIPLDPISKDLCFALCTKARHRNIPADIDLQERKLQKALQHISKSGTEFIVIMGEEERKSKKIKIKQLSSREEKTFDLENFIETLQTLFEKKDFSHGF